ncbi:MAG: MFS transporter [Eubacteriales bacterium]|nr:MFS transporter [Eubacteriales bacterium]
MKEFWKKLPRYRRLVILELYFVYFSLGVAVILIGSILPSLRDANALSYGQSGNLLSIQSIGFLLVGLVTGEAVNRLGIKKSFILTISFLPVGMFMLVRGGSFSFLSAAMFLVGLSKGAITDYNNRVISDYADGEAGPINSLHIFFAIGACLAPFAALAMNRLSADRGWIYAMILSAMLATAAVVFAIFVKIDLGAPHGPNDSSDSAGSALTNVSSADTALSDMHSRETGSGAAESDRLSDSGAPAGQRLQERSSSGSSLAFFREPLFLWTLLIGVCDQALESSLMGWLTTYYLETGIVGETAAQMTTSLLWLCFLIGRISCMLIAARWRPEKMLMIMGIGTAVSMACLSVSIHAPVLFLSTAGLGLCLSGVYGTAVSNASRIFSRYSSSMGLYVTIAGIGGAAAPAAIGWVSDLSTVRNGFRVLVIVSVILTFAVWMNRRLYAGAHKS